MAGKHDEQNDRSLDELSNDELVAQLRLSRQKTHELAKRFEIALRDSDICVFLQDLDFKFVWVHNPALGFDEKELIGRSLEELAPADTSRQSRQLKLAALESNEVQRGEVTIQDGLATRHFEVAVEPYRNIFGEVIGILGVAMDVTEQRRQVEELQQALREMSHRSKNQLATLLSILRQTSHTAPDVTTFATAFEERLRGLVKTQDQLVANNWRGIRIDEMIAAQAHVLNVPLDDRLRLEGASILIKPEPAQNLSLAFHELIRNALAFGALSTVDGRIRVTWRLNKVGDKVGLLLSWIETGGPSVTPDHQTTPGFGMTLVRRLLRYAIDGDVGVDFRESGLRVRMQISNTCIVA